MPAPPITLGGSGALGGPVPVVSVDDVLAVLPALLKPSDPPPIRDALIAALTEIFFAYQKRAQRSADLVSILRSTGPSLVALAEDHGVFQVQGDTDETLRARMLGIPQTVSPAAIMAAVNTVLAPFTSVQAQYFERADCWCVGSASSTRNWRSYVWQNVTSAAPTYPDRYYGVRPQSNPGGARVFSDHHGRVIILRVPPISSSQSAGAFTSTRGFSVGSGAARTFVRAIEFTENDVYSAVVGAVQRIKGQGIRVGLIVDPKLS